MLSCVGVSHNYLGECGDKTVQYVIYASAHKIKDHWCGVTSCNMKMGKISIYIILKCANCGLKYQATAFRCPAKLKA